MSPGESANCVWPELFIRAGDVSKISHKFRCDNDDYEAETDFPINAWTKIEYSQLPIQNTDLAEVSIKLNENLVYKFVNYFPRDYQDIAIYYGYKKDEIGMQYSIPEGKIRNLTIEENEPGLLNLLFEHIVN